MFLECRLTFTLKIEANCIMYYYRVEIVRHKMLVADYNSHRCN